MKISIKEEYIANGSYESMTISATTELGTVILENNEDYDRDRDLPKEHNVTITEFDSVEEIRKKGYANWAEVYEILDDETYAAFYAAKMAELEAAKEAGDTVNYWCTVDGRFYNLVRGRWKASEDPVR